MNGSNGRASPPTTRPAAERFSRLSMRPPKRSTPRKTKHETAPKRGAAIKGAHAMTEDISAQEETQPEQQAQPETPQPKEETDPNDPRETQLAKSDLPPNAKVQLFAQGVTTHIPEEPPP